MVKLLVLFTILMLVPIKVLAHDGSDHVNDLEFWVSAIGIVLIVLASLSVLLSKPRRSYDHFTENNPTPEN